MTLKICLLLSVSIIAACMDLKYAKISNTWIYTIWVSGLLYQLWELGLAGIGVFLCGGIVPILMLYILFYFRMLGAGDIKLLSGIGGIMGAISVLPCIFYSFLIGGVLSFAILLSCGNLLQRLSYFFNYVTEYGRTKKWRPYRRKGMEIENFHFSIPILLSVILYIGGVYR